MIYLEETEANYYAPQIKLEENASVLGEIYCSKNLELRGMVSGHVSTDAFIAMENGSIYQNHLYNGSINSSGLPLEYAGLLSANLEVKNIAKWLY